MTLESSNFIKHFKKSSNFFSQYVLPNIVTCQDDPTELMVVGVGNEQGKYGNDLGALPLSYFILWTSQG